MDKKRILVDIGVFSKESLRNNLLVNGLYCKKCGYISDPFYWLDWVESELNNLTKEIRCRGCNDLFLFSDHKVPKTKHPPAPFALRCEAKQRFGLILEPGSPLPDPNKSIEENYADGCRFSFE